VFGDLAHGVLYAAGALLVLAGVAKGLSFRRNHHGQDSVIIALTPPLRKWNIPIIIAICMLELVVGGAALLYPANVITAAAVTVLGMAFVGVLGFARRRRIAAPCGCLGSTGPGAASSQSMCSMLRAILVLTAGSLGMIAASIGSAAANTKAAMGIGVIYFIGLVILSPEVITRFTECGRPLLFSEYDALRELHHSSIFRAAQTSLQLAERPDDSWRKGCTRYIWFPLPSSSGVTSRCSRGVLFVWAAGVIKAQLVDVGAP